MKLLLTLSLAFLQSADRPIDRPAVDSIQPFAAEVLPTGDVYRGMFSPDGAEFYYFRGTGRDDDYRIHVIRRGGGWKGPQQVDLGGEHSDMYPALSPDGRTMVFTSYRPFPGAASDTPPQANL